MRRPKAVLSDIGCHSKSPPLTLIWYRRVSLCDIPDSAEVRIVRTQTGENKILFASTSGVSETATHDAHEDPRR